MKELPRVMGYAVQFRESCEHISCVHGFFRPGKIVVGPMFNRLTPFEQGAVLVHEVGHLELGHARARWRCWWWLIFKPMAFRFMCIEQEYEADQFAARRGYGAGLCSIYRRVENASGLLHPPVQSRIAKLTS
jgi:Zn-dependent protease with chaperone function